MTASPKKRPLATGAALATRPAAAPDSVLTIAMPPMTYLAGSGLTVAMPGTADTVEFTSAYGTLADGDASATLNNIVGFRPGDAIDLTSVGYDLGAAQLADVAGQTGAVHLTGAPGGSATLNFAYSGLIASDFVLSDDGAGGTLVSLSPDAPVAYWTGGGPGLWTDAGRWSGFLVPQRGYAVDIVSTQFATIPLSVAVPSGSAQSVLLNAINGTLSVTGALVVGGTATVANGVLALQPGVQMVAANLRMGGFTNLALNAGSVLILTGGSNPESEPGTPALEEDFAATLSGATLNAATGSVLIGSNSLQALGQISATASSVTAELTALGSNARSFGGLTINGGTWTDLANSTDLFSGDMIVGNGGQGDLTLTGGGVLRESHDALFGSPVLGGTASALITGGGLWLVTRNMTGNASPASFGAPLLTVGSSELGAGSVSVGGLVSGMGLIDITGGTLRADTLADSNFNMTGGALAAFRLQGASNLTLTGGAVARLYQVDGGGITLDAASGVRIGAVGDPAAGVLLIAAGASATLDAGLAAPTLDVLGTLTGSADTALSYAGSIEGSGTIAPQGDVTLNPTGLFATTLLLTEFSTVTLGNGALYGGTIDAAWNFTSGLQGFAQAYADLPNLPYATAAALWDGGIGVSSLGTLAPFHFDAPGASISSTGWGLSDDGNGGTLIAFDAVTVCYAAGTAIATPRGACDVAALRPGDLVLARDGGGWTARPLRWVGRFSVDLARHPQPDQAAPVLIRAGAVAGGVPARDLRVSPDHAVWVDGALIPARLLVNGASIARDRTVRRVTYHHLELETHSLLLAEGLPAESYLDTGNRAHFAAEAGVRPLFPDLSASAWHGGACAPLLGDGACAPLLGDGPALHAIRARLLARARHLGWRLHRSAAPRVLTDSARLALTQIAPLCWRASVPPGTRQLHLLSRSFVPHDLDPASTDRRALGLAVTALRLGASDLRGQGGGWHTVEAGWHWTGGAARIPVSNSGVLALRCAAAGPGYWVAPGGLASIKKQLNYS